MQTISPRAPHTDAFELMLFVLSAFWRIAARLAVKVEDNEAS
jgi:hypothetical protein